MILKEKGYVCDRLSRGDRLLIGNGCYGYRGTLEENTKEQCVALNAACFYDQCGDNWRESVNMPNPLFCCVEVNGKQLCQQNAAAHTEKLDMKNGAFYRSTHFKVEKINAKVSSVRFFAQYRCDLLVSRFSVETDAVAELKITSGIDCCVWNISGEHFTVSATQTEPLSVFCTTNEGKSLAVEVTENASQKVAYILNEQGKLCNVYSFCGNKFVVTKFCRLSHDGLLWGAPETDFDEIVRKNTIWWKNKWKHSRVVISDCHNLQNAMDYSVYQLLTYAPKTDSSIGARGLSGQTYKGAVFWDTEIFMLPFYLKTDAETAKRLVRYRIATLEGAIQKAKHYGYEGAFFPWESQNGKEACSDFNVTDVFSGRPVRTYFKDKQIHISADIAVALFKTYKETCDLSLLTEGGLALLTECALFYNSYAYYNHNKKRYELLDVIGPDEYHERVNNNAYTNYMAHECCQNCLEAWTIVSKKAPQVAATQKEKYGDALKKIKKFKKELYLPQPNEQGVIEQFDGYFRLEDVSVQTVRNRLVHPNEYWGGSNGVATATKVIKQADVVALMCVLPHRFSKQVMQANYNYYLPYTEHGSSLSASMYSLCACFVGSPDDAYAWFEKSATTDLKGSSKKYAGKVYIGGAHPAACGGAWMTAFFGFACQKDGSALPKQIFSLKIKTEKGSVSVAQK